VWHPIYSNSGEKKCDYRPKRGINIPRGCVNGYSITAAPANSVTHGSFWWCVYQAHSIGGEYATRPVAWAPGTVSFSVRGYEVPSEPSEPSGTPVCFRRKLGLLLMVQYRIHCRLQCRIQYRLQYRIQCHICLEVTLPRIRPNRSLL